MLKVLQEFCLMKWGNLCNVSLNMNGKLIYQYLFFCSILILAIKFIAAFQTFRVSNANSNKLIENNISKKIFRGKIYLLFEPFTS